MILEKYDSTRNNKQLQESTADTKMLIRGYGYNDILKLKLEKFKPNENAHWYLGEYQDN